MTDQVRDKREDLIRALTPAKIELRATGDGEAPVMTGHFAVFNQWTEINSLWEGNFMERFAPGSFKRTINNNREKMRVLFQHGTDPQVGEKVLGPIRTLGEDSEGAAYEVPLLNASYVRDWILPGLEAGLYGASFRFRVNREIRDTDPGVSAHNPDGIEERTVTEAQVMEFGPVTFPAYEGATAGVRSLSDDFLMRCFQADPEKLRAMFDLAEDLDENAQLADVIKELTAEVKRQAEVTKSAGFEMKKYLAEVISSQTGEPVSAVEEVEADLLADEVREEAIIENTELEIAESHLVEKQRSTSSKPRLGLTSTDNRPSLDPTKGLKLNG